MLAVGSVIADHAIGGPVGGFVGVDVFFVISGFLITGLLIREFDRSGRISFLGFYRRRIKRLLPAALLVTLVTVVVAAFVLPRSRALSALVDGIFATLFTANWRFAAVGTDYFEAGTAPSPLQHFWSLSVEEQFYLVWPWMLVLVLTVAGARRIWWLLAVASAVTLASFGWALLETGSAPTLAYFSTISRAWELGIGAIVAILAAATRARIPAAVAPVATLVGIVGIVASWFLVTPESGFPAPIGALPVLSTALVLFAGLEGGARYDRIAWPITNRVSRYIGDISYSLYLWHFPVVVLGTAFLPAGSRRYLVVVLVLTLVLSVLSYHLVEDPVRRSSWLVTKPSWRPRTLVALGAAAAVVLVAGVAVGAQVTRPAATLAADDVATRDDCFGAAALANPECGPSTMTGEIVPSVDELADDIAGAFDCWRREDGELRTCTYGDERPDALRVAVVGDSHAAMLMPALRPIADDLGWTLDSYLGFGCQWRDQGDRSNCAEVMAEVDAMLTDPADPYDVIITSGARWAAQQDGAAEEFASAWAPAVALGTQVLVIKDSPTIEQPVLDCVQRVGFDPRTDACGMPLSARTDPPDPMVDAVARVEGAQLIDIDDLYCDADDCPAVIGGVVVYRDTVSHITGTYMRTMEPFLRERLASAIAG